jgi:hypothetical protein
MKELVRRHAASVTGVISGFDRLRFRGHWKLRLLRAHGLIKQVPKTHRYMLTNRGREIITTLLAARSADADKLLAAA